MVRIATDCAAATHGGAENAVPARHDPVRRYHRDAPLVPL